MREWIFSGLVFFIVVALFLAVAWKWGSGPKVAPTPAVTPAAVVQGTPTPDGAGEDGRYGLGEEALRRRQRHEMHVRAAEERFGRTVAMDGLRPDDVAPGVRALFRTLRLEPVVKPGVSRPGYVEGLRITRLSPRNPLAEQGFREGDRLVRINGQALRDPAQIAHLMVRLRGHAEICADRGGRDYCRHVDMAVPSG